MFQEPDPGQPDAHGELGKPLAAASSTIIIFIGGGTLIYHALEKWSWVESLYFSITSLTTVGYGDIAPTTDLSRLFTCFYLITGVGVVVASLGIIGSRYLERRDRKLQKKRH